MSYLILARKYRPQKFSDLTGQQTTAKILQSAVQQDRLAHAYLFSGPRGIGKTTTARIFAKTLNCRKNNPAGKDKNAAVPEPCDSCDSCVEIARGGSLDVLELDAASHTQVDKIREVVIDTVNFAPVRDRYKIFIIDEVHMLSHHSFNALLKTLEEPPPHVVFILATTDFHRIPTTIVSRCQRFRFLPLTQREILSNLQGIAKTESIPIEEGALALVAKSAGGSMRDALSIFDQVISHLPHLQAQAQGQASIDQAKVEEILGVVREDFLARFLGQVAARDAKAVLESAGQLLREGHDLSYFLKELREAFREMLVRKCGYRDEDSLFGSRVELPTDRFSLEQLLRGAQLLTKCAEQMRWNDLPHVVFESYAVRLCQETAGAGELLRRLERLEERLKPGAAAARPSAPEPAEPDPQPRAGAAPREEPPAEPEASRAAADPEPASSSSVDDQALWIRTLAILQHSKPFLHQVLETARVRALGGQIELTLPKAFSLDTVKRHQPLIERVLEEVAKKRVPLILGLGEAKPAFAAESAVEPQAPAPEDDVAVDDAEEEAAPAGGSYEAAGAPEPVSELDLAVEDEGAKKFLGAFSGKVTRAQTKPKS